MAANRAKGGFKTQLQRHNGLTFETIAEVVDIPTASNKEAVIVDATHMDSPNNRTEQIPVGLISEGDQSFVCHLLDVEATHAALNTDMEGFTKRKYRIVPPSFTNAREFDAYVKSIAEVIPIRDRMTFNVTLAITGPVARVPTGS